MKWKRSRSLGPIYDTATVALAVSATIVVWLGFRTGGVWAFVAWAFVIGLGLIAWGVFVEPHRLTVRRYRETLVEHPSSWIRIVFLSDMHAGGFRGRSWYERVANEADSLGADLLFLGGDMVADFGSSVEDLKPLSSVTARLGRYFVLGNHDYLDDPAHVRRTVAGWGFADLTNGNVSVQKDGRTLQLTALDDTWHGKPLVPPIRVSASVPHVTIAHEPDVALDFKTGDTELIVSGHTHGGQIRLPFVGALSKLPSLLGRKADFGKKVVNGVPVIISDGCGETDVRARLFCPPEVTVVEVGI